VGGFYPVEGGLCGIEGFEPQHWPGDFLNKSVILFHSVIEVFDLANLNGQAQQPGEHQQDIDVFKPGQVGAAFVHDHFCGQAVAVNSLPEEGGGRRFAAAFGQHKVNGVAKLVDHAIQVNPFAFDFDIRFVHAPKAATVRLRLFAAKAISG